MNEMPGQHMRAEIAEAPGVFVSAAMQNVTIPPFSGIRAIYTIARGSSDAVANILSYEMMRELGLPMTGLPPSIFSVGKGVSLKDCAALIVSQSGASHDLLRSAEGAKAAGAQVLAIVNTPNSPVQACADGFIPIGAGPEKAVPATKTVVGSIGAGMALIGALVPEYALKSAASAKTIAEMNGKHLPQTVRLLAALQRASNLYVVGRDTGYGAALELALKFKECCALHAEAYSSAEVLHGPLQLVTHPFLILILDTEQPDIQDSLNIAEARFRAAGVKVFRIRPSDVGAVGLTPAAAAAALLILTYPLVLQTALVRKHDPDRPNALSKVTQTL